MLVFSREQILYGRKWDVGSRWRASVKPSNIKVFYSMHLDLCCQARNQQTSTRGYSWAISIKFVLYSFCSARSLCQISLSHGNNPAGWRGLLMSSPFPITTTLSFSGYWPYYPSFSYLCRWITFIEASLPASKYIMVNIFGSIAI